MPGYGDERSTDLPELIAQTQKETELPLPPGAQLLPRYLGLTDALAAPTDVLSAVDPMGPSYYCSPPGGGNDPIRCAFWMTS